jgi:hypothetical protein
VKTQTIEKKKMMACEDTSHGKKKIKTIKN